MTEFRRIATEEAFSIPEHMAALRQLTKSTWDSLDLKLPRRSAVPGGPFYDGLTDLEGERLRIMDEDGVSMHLLSLTSPCVQMFDADLACEMAAIANHRVADA